MFCPIIDRYFICRWAFQAEDGSEHPEVVTMCCAIKPLASWLLEEVVSVTRERCGGQGYLSANRYVILASHWPTQIK